MELLLRWTEACLDEREMPLLAFEKEDIETDFLWDVLFDTVSVDSIDQAGFDQIISLLNEYPNYIEKRIKNGYNYFCVYFIFNDRQSAKEFLKIIKSKK